MLQHTKRQVKLFEMNFFTMFITTLCVIFLIKKPTRLATAPTRKALQPRKSPEGLLVLITNHDHLA